MPKQGSFHLPWIKVHSRDIGNQPVSMPSAGTGKTRTSQSGSLTSISRLAPRAFLITPHQIRHLQPRNQDTHQRIHMMSHLSRFIMRMSSSHQKWNNPTSSLVLSAPPPRGEYREVKAAFFSPKSNRSTPLSHTEQWRSAAHHSHPGSFRKHWCSGPIKSASLLEGPRRCLVSFVFSAGLFLTLQVILIFSSCGQPLTRLVLLFPQYSLNFGPAWIVCKKS